MPIDLKQLQKNEYIFGSTNASVDRVLVAKFVGYLMLLY